MLKPLMIALALPLALAAQDAKTGSMPSQSAVQAELKVGTGVEKKDIVGAATEFKIAPDTKLYAWARVTGASSGNKVSLAFFRGDKKVSAQELSVGGSPWRVHAYRTFRAGDAGDWMVKVLGEDGSQIAAAAFKVEIAK